MDWCGLLIPLYLTFRRHSSEKLDGKSSSFLSLKAWWVGLDVLGAAYQKLRSINELGFTSKGKLAWDWLD
jgi:hypothetical protein